jgi:hypothetical protein
MTEWLARVYNPLSVRLARATLATAAADAHARTHTPGAAPRGFVVEAAVRCMRAPPLCCMPLRLAHSEPVALDRVRSGDAAQPAVFVTDFEAPYTRDVAAAVSVATAATLPHADLRAFLRVVR